MGVVGMHRNWRPELQDPGKGWYEKTGIGKVFSKVAKEDPSQDQPQKVAQALVPFPGPCSLAQARYSSTAIGLLRPDRTNAWEHE